ncbi:fungal-specific transcription factor domain-containing protein [Plectosphaerella plurivora]|uniref:Fungal-specific transcription factor domain-containing protein n=1 Tax=Plectosphaerella plurivora TaxID=936078 RepID=A0A9P8V8J9_9PEZI|nr:fungal-specific transcription factor domain-containing protein [Plectosphaerella plurivora]
MASAPAPSSKAKAVCVACRARKKRCNGERPSCSNCTLRQELCSYPPPRRSVATGLHNRNLDNIHQSSEQLQLPPFTMSDNLPYYVDLPSSILQSNPILGPDTLWLMATTDDQQSLLPYTMSPQELSAPAVQDLTTDITNQMTAAAEPHAPSASWPACELPPEFWSVETSTLASSTTLDPEAASPALPSLPSQGRMDELSGIFFQRFYPILPIFFEERLSAALLKATTAKPEPESSLLFAFLALVAGSHPAADVKSQQSAWYGKARHLYDQTLHIPSEPLQTLQAAACIVLHALIVGDHSAAWLVLGKAWRQCVALGLNQMDSASAKRNGPSVEWRELEERRRTIWSLFMFDRGMCFPIGLAHSIDERQLRVNLPMDEDAAQNADSPPQELDSVLFTPNLRKLLSLVGAASQQTPPNVFHYLIISYLLLGRIVEHMYQPESEDDEDEDDAEQHRSMLASLQQDVSHMRLMLPRSVTDVTSAAHLDCIHVVWLNAIMNVNTIFLFHRPPTRREQSLSCDNDDGSPSCSASSNWQICVAVSRKTALLIREASLVSTDLLVNPNVAAPVFACARILVIEHLLSSSPPESGSRVPHASGLVADLQVFLLLFDRLSEAFTGVGVKFRNRVLDLLEQGPDIGKEMKAAGSKTLLENCLKWQGAALAAG